MKPKLFRRILQRDSKSFSNWIRLGPNLNLACCDCGLVHRIEFRVRPFPKLKQVELAMRLRRHVTKTKEQRAARKAKGLS